MILKRQKLVKVVALFLAFSIFQLYVRVNAASAQEPATPAPQNIGKLSTTDNKDILVNKNEADTGATILDGALLETSDCVSATVRFGPLDEVNLGTNTIAVINYSDGKVKVSLKQGCARVLVGPNSNGTIETPDGKSMPATQPESSNRQRAEVCYPSGARSDFDPRCKPIPPVGGGGVFSVPVIGGIVAGVVGVIVLVAASSSSSGDNASFSAPTF